MVGSLMVWKLAHCKHFNKRSRRSFNTKLDENDYAMQYFRDSIVKDELDVSEKNRICRVCLKTGDIQIYEDNSLNISDALSNFAGIEIRPDDEYPKFLCQACHALLQGAILLRKTAQDSDQILRYPPKDDSEDENTFEAVERASDFVEKDKEVDMEQSKYFCKKCIVEFDTFADYNKHRLSDEHENLRRTCPICKNSYTSLYFKKHMTLHTNPEVLFVCDVCGKKFTIKSLFTRHRAIHFNNFPFNCSLCPYKGRFKDSLKMHMRRHTGEKPYQCPHCPARFVNKSNLNKHMCIHKGKFDFKCETCGRGFYTKRNLDQHYKVDHTGIKDHTCNVCGKAFGYRKQMMKHQLKVHKREKLQNGRMPLYLQMQSKKLPNQDT
ncbi:zinc finger protein OZF-like [Battus philenor]|uniref:zinc finger protein OZF-like n=1 Tax=Battus philenor TaxID=42288 RepID=UPI0035CECDC3